MRRRLSRLTETLARVLSTKRIAATLDRFERRAGITRIGEVGILVSILLWILARVVAGRSMYLFAYGSLLLVVATIVSGRRKLPLEGQRSDTRPRVREGEILNIEIGLTARRRLSTIVLEEQIPDKLGEAVRLPIATLHSGDEVHHSYRLQCRRRGAYTVGPLVARWGDPVGVTQREMELAPPFEVLVHPSIEPVVTRPLTRQWEDPPIRPPVSKPWHSGMEFYGMREYAPGDDLRRVVWQAYARTGKVLVRESEQGVTDQVTVILDNHPHYHTREEPSESFETAVRAAASLAVKYLVDGYTVTVHVNDGPLIRPQRGSAAQIPVLDALARLEFGKAPITQTITTLAADPRRDAHTILITPRLGAKEAAQLKLLVNKGVAVQVVALIWEEEAEETLRTAAALGCGITELRPGQSIASALSVEVGAGRR